MKSRHTITGIQMSGISNAEMASTHETVESLASRVSSDLEAFAELYRRFNHRVYNFCLGRLRCDEAAEDATSQIFLKALEGLRRTQVRQVTPWHFTIAYREVADRYWQHANHLPIDDFAEIPRGDLLLEEQVAALGEAGDLQLMLN